MDKLVQFDHWIKRGELATARRELSRTLKRRVPRAHAVPYGRIALRLGLYDAGIRVMHPWVRSSSRRPATPSALEKAEYAHLLVKVGALDEARGLLAEARSAGLPPTLFYEAAARVAEWNYGGAIPFLLAYLKAKGLSDYDRVVAQVNLAAAYVYEEKFQRAESLLRSLLHHCALRGYGFALGRTLEIAAENFLARRDWAKADRFLAEAAKKMGDAFSPTALYVKTYRALGELYRSDGSAAARKGVAEVRDEAARTEHWETVRNCDRATAIVDEDAGALVKLWYGTPFESYREKIDRDLARLGGKLPPHYDWCGDEAKAGRGLLDLGDGTWNGTDIGIVRGGVPHRLLVALSRDFWRPQRISTLHFSIHPDLLYHPQYARGKVHNAAYRLRGIFEAARVPIAIAELGSSYLLTFPKDVTLRVRRGELVEARFGRDLERLRATLPHPFSVAEAVRALDRPRRTVFRVLVDGCARGVLERSGKAKKTRYRFVDGSSD